MNLEDHAKTVGGPEIVVASDLPSRPRAEIQSSDLTSADELTPEEQFPEFGEFLEVQLVDEEGEVVEGEDGKEWWETPGTLAAAVVEIAKEQETEIEGSVLDVRSAAKTASGEWRWTVELLE